jgi:uncharacterized RmlC-like cupin family protein
MIERLIFKPTSTKEGRWLLDLQDIDIVTPKGFKVAHQALVSLEPLAWAGNHRHGRRELLLGMTGDLHFIWRETDGTRHETPMIRPDGKLELFVIPSGMPHLVENRSSAAGASLFELSDRKDEAIMLQGAESLLVKV